MKTMLQLSDRLALFSFEPFAPIASCWLSDRRDNPHNQEWGSEQFETESVICHFRWETRSESDAGYVVVQFRYESV